MMKDTMQSMKESFNELPAPKRKAIITGAVLIAILAGATIFQSCKTKIEEKANAELANAEPVKIVGFVEGEDDRFEDATIRTVHGLVTVTDCDAFTDSFFRKAKQMREQGMTSKKLRRMKSEYEDIISYCADNMNKGAFEVFKSNVESL